MFKPSLLRNSIRSALLLGATSLVATNAFAQEAAD